MIKMYAIPNCDTVKKARTYLDKRKIKYEFIDFKKYILTNEELQRWENFYGDLPVNKKGITYRKYKDEFEKLSKKDQIEFIKKQTSIIKRPIIEKNEKVLIIGFDEDAYSKIKF